jgi:hypothetical protein
MPKEKTEEFLATARKRFEQANTEEQPIREEARIDLRFVSGQQWDDQVAYDRSRSDRPVMTFNRLHTFVQQVSNEARNAKPSIKFSPVDSGADSETADVLEGIARHIQYASKADVAYDTAVQYSAGCSFGYFRLLTDYCSNKSNDLEIKFEPVNDPFSVFGVLIPKTLGRKPRWGFVIDSLSRDEFEQEYPDSEVVSCNWSNDVVSTAGDWISDETVRIAEYWYIETTREKIDVDGRKRDVRKETVYSCKTNGVEILEGPTEWVGRCIPIFAVPGWSMIVDGKPQLMSVVRFQRDPQKMLNACFTSMGERLGLGNRAPYIGYKGQFKDPKWQNANKVNYPFLEAEPVTIAGNLAPLPQRQNVAVEVHDLAQVAMLMIDDQKAAAGIFDASLGKEAPAKSGVAIFRQQQQSNITNFHFIDNLNRAQEEAGKELAYMIPRVYDTPRAIRIVGEDETEKVIRVNEPFVDPDSGEQKQFILEADQFDATVNIGPAYNTKRQEAFAMLTEMAQGNPQLMATSGDIVFRNSDIPGKDELSERMKRFINLQMPGLIEDEKKKQDPQVLANQLQMVMQQHEALTQQLNTVSEELRTRSFEVQSRERIELARLEQQREDAYLKYQTEIAKLGSSEALSKLQTELQAIKLQMDSEFRTQQHAASETARYEQMGHEVGMKGMDQQHQSSMAEMQAEQQAEQAKQQAEQPE